MTDTSIIHKGTLTKEKLRSLAEIHFGLNNNDHLYNPAKNHGAISVIRQPDGNYIGQAWKNEKLIEVRQGDPNTVITLLVTHE